MPPLNANDPRPPYVQIADEIRTAIQSGQLQPGERMESGRDLAKRYGVAQMTARNALEVLRQEGLIVSWQGRGVFVADMRPEGQVSVDDIMETIENLRSEISELRERLVHLEGRQQ